MTENCVLFLTFTIIILPFASLLYTNKAKISSSATEIRESLRGFCFEVLFFSLLVIAHSFVFICEGKVKFCCIVGRLAQNVVQIILELVCFIFFSFNSLANNNI